MFFLAQKAGSWTNAFRAIHVILLLTLKPQYCSRFRRDPNKVSFRFPKVLDYVNKPHVVE